MTIDLVDLAFALLALAVFRVCRPAPAVLGVVLGGWMLLPVGHFPSGAAEAAFPYWIIGLALPSEMLLTKAWVAPAAALLGVLLFDRAALRRWRPRAVDAPVALWCVWPLLQSLTRGTPVDPPGGIASLYLLGAWGLPWLLGRVYFAQAAGRLLLLRGMAWSLVACLPFSVIEGLFGPTLYGHVYGPHPFRLDGNQRYLGQRPIGFFEHGNQFGLWVALATLAAVWLALRVAEEGGDRQQRLHRALALVGVLMTLASQSAGAIILLALGLAFLAACRWVRARWWLGASLALLLLGGAVYASGALPILRYGKETALGQQVVAAFKSVGRGSFTWRIAQDQRLLPAAMARPLVGTGHWDWWRAHESRPWGLTLLVLGEFGLIGLGAMLGLWLWPALAAAWRAPPGAAWRATGAPLALAAIVVLALLDALMNSFIFFPAIIVAGALAADQETVR